MEFPHRIMRPPQQHQEEEEREKLDMSSTTSSTRTSSSSSSSSPHQWGIPHSVAPAATEREHMFEKVVTPSDVGKLNRLVIPKQHAKRYFPLDPPSAAAAAAADKGGLLLNFEEGPTGRTWRFRYTYWNSSQSYVMTKGWSRFVKDKRLDAGDTVSFSRSSSPAGDRLFIDWRRRPVPLPPYPPAILPSVVPAWASLYHHHVLPPPLPMYFRPVPPQLRVAAEHGILDSVPVVAHRPRAQPRRQVRLFGVNLEGYSQQQEEQQPASPSPMQWRLSAAPAGRSTAHSELQLMPMPMEESKR